jgi:hypothetical protein
LIFETLYNEHYEGPQSFAGYSGGGLWQLLVNKEAEGFRVTDFLLSGVAFHQSHKIQRQSGEIVREITCHGRLSLYSVLISEARASG